MVKMSSRKTKKLHKNDTAVTKMEAIPKRIGLRQADIWKKFTNMLFCNQNVTGI